MYSTMIDVRHSIPVNMALPSLEILKQRNRYEAITQVVRSFAAPGVASAGGQHVANFCPGGC
jgi:hypothetical protein